MLSPPPPPPPFFYTLLNNTHTVRDQSPDPMACKVCIRLGYIWKACCNAYMVAIIRFGSQPECMALFIECVNYNIVMVSNFIPI